ncbi:MAG: glycosyl hydrolase, partial [Planctomycetota bacterium]
MTIRVTTLLLMAGWGHLAAAQVFRYEAEDGTLFGTEVRSSVAGYSGTGYVTDFDSAGGTDRFELQVDVPAGVYEMWVGYRSPFGEKGYDFRVDTQLGSGMFPASTTFAEDRAGIFELQAGTNTLGIQQGWGYYDVDYLEFRPFEPPPLQPVPAQLNNPLANTNTQMLMNYLVSQYGQRTLAGQQHNVWTNPAFPEPAYLQKSGGLQPAMRGSDLVRYSPSRVAFGEPNHGETEQAIQWAEQTGGIVTMAWHWNAPADLINQPGMEWWRGFYTDATTFDLPGALADPTSSDYQLLLRDIDAIAVELQKFETADVPVIWRPLHEAQGGWFWWGAHGPDNFKALWHLMHERLTDTHGIDNLIWEFTSLAAEG